VILTTKEHEAVRLHVVQLPGEYCGTGDCSVDACDVTWGGGGSNDPTASVSGDEQQIVVEDRAELAYAIAVSVSASIESADVTLIIQDAADPETELVRHLIGGELSMIATLGSSGGTCEINTQVADWDCSLQTPGSPCP